jgi:CheY-like chemotaxis protein
MSPRSAGPYAVVTMSARILVVEDDRTMAEVLLAYLQRAGYETNWTTDGSEAHQLWRR